jgi:hypothetical protein
MADIIIINGEGTCHHARPHAENLLSVVEHPVSRGKPVALINALYQENPRDWLRYLEKFSLISPRDSWSAMSLSDLLGESITYLPDLSISEGFTPDLAHTPRDVVTVGESVLPATTAELIAFTDSCHELVFLPLISTLKGPKPTYPNILRPLRRAYANLHKEYFSIGRPNVRFCRNEKEFLRVLASSKVHISGRFHAICFSIVSRTPFFALTSNTWKIEALIDDFGIDSRRIVKAAQIEDILANPGLFDFSDAEMQKIQRAVEYTVSGSAKLFDKLQELSFGLMAKE